MPDRFAHLVGRLPTLHGARSTAGRGDLVFQQGVPGDFDLPMFTLGPAGAVRHRRPFTEGTLAEVRGVRARAGRPPEAYSTSRAASLMQ